MKLIAPNTLLQNRYLIVHLIGKGGMGEVYLAVDQRLGSAIALKRTFFSDDETFGDAFEREARTLARLRHPVLPKVSDHFTENETQFLVMEHIAGEDLFQRLEINKKPFPLNWVLFWADQLLDALAYLHAHEPPIIHRDIKPQNLKLTAENHIVLLDFGLAKNSLAATRTSTSGSVVGYTPHYAPMEQIRGTGTDARSDIYSLSATLYQVLTASVPPDALSRADAIISGQEDPIKPINETNAEVTKAVSDVILKGMSVSQEKRFASAKQMQKALRDAFAQLYNETSEQQTIAFKFEEKSENEQSGQKLDFSNAPPVITQIPATDLQSQVSSANPSVPSTQNSLNSYQSQPQHHNQNFKTNVSVDSSGIPSQRQADIKTEAFPAASSAIVSSAQETDFIGDETKQNEDFPTRTRFAPPESDFSPATVQPVLAKSKSNVSAIIGGLGALLLLAISVAGIGWYMLSGAPKTTTRDITAPPASPETNLSTAPTLEAVTNTNSYQQSETFVSDNTNQTNERAVNGNTSQISGQAPVQTGQTNPAKAAVPKSTPQIVMAKTPKPAAPPKPKQTPKGGRTDILQ